MPIQLSANIGETSASFLNLGVGANALAMGGAVTSLSTGVHSLFWNPGCLGWLVGTEATFMHSEYFQSIRYENLGFAHGTNSFGIGFSLKGLYLVEMEERIGPSENSISTFGAYFVVPSLSLAKSLGNNFSLGTSVKLVYQKIGEDKAVSFGGDIGMSVKGVIRSLKAGFVLTNLGTKIGFLNSSFSLPTRLRTGFSYSLFNENVSLAFDVIKPLKEDFEYCFGVEGIIMEKLCLRAGYRSELQNTGSFAGASAGVGFKIEDIDIDYAFSSYGELGLTHNFSISYVFGRAKRRIVEFKNANYLEAISEFELVIEIEPTNEVVKEWLKTTSDALVKVQVERIKLGEESEEKISEHFKKGLENFSKKDYKKAIDEWNNVLSLDTAHTQAREYIEKAQLKIKEQTDETLTRIDMYISQSKWIQASNEVNRVLTLDPENKDGLMKKKEIEKNLIGLSAAHEQNGIRFYEQGKFGLAETELKMALNFDKSNIEANKYLAKIKSERKEALGEDINELYIKGINAYTQENFQLAIFYWKRVLEIDTEHANAKRNIGRAEEKLKIFEE